MTLQEEESVIVSRVKLEAVGSLFVNRMNEGESNGLGWSFYLYLSIFFGNLFMLYLHFKTREVRSTYF